MSIAEPGCEALAEYCAAWVDARFAEREARGPTGIASEAGLKRLEKVGG